MSRISLEALCHDQERNVRRALGNYIYEMAWDVHQSKLEFDIPFYDSSRKAFADATHLV